MNYFFIVLIFFNVSIFGQSRPAMVKSNDVNEVDIRIRKQRSTIKELKIKDTKRKENKNFRKDRAAVRDNKTIRKRVQKKINKERKRSKKDNPIKRIVTNKTGRDKKLQKARRFREKDTHITKSGSRGKVNRKARIPFPPRQQN